MARKDNLNSNLFNDKLYTEGFRDDLTPLDAQHMNKLVDGALLNEKSITDLKNDLSNINKELSNVKGGMLSYTDPHQSIGEQGARLVRDKIDVPSKSEVSYAIQDAISKADISGGSAEGAVVYNDIQELTENEQKTARQNVGINLISDDNEINNGDIPNVGFMAEYMYDAMKNYCITYTEGQMLHNSDKRQAAENIGAVTYVEGQELSDVDRFKARSNIKVVSYEAPIDDECALTDEEKEQARKNIGASAAEIYVKTPEEEEAIPACALYVDLTADAAATTSEITEESKNELPTCEAVKNYVISILDDLDSKLQKLL